MPLLAGDIRFARSANMADVPEGGGPPSAQFLTSGRSNQILPDISEETRTVGRVEIYQIFSVLRNSDSTPLLGGNVILAEPPADPNISITLLTLKNPFATRADIARRIESGMSPGSEWAGYLLEDHYTTMRSLTLFQRPGMTPPTIGRTYLLVCNEGLPSERRQRVRIKATNMEQRTFTEVVNNQLIDFVAQVTTCELFDGLMYDYPGSPPSRAFARNITKSMIRETVYSDSGMFYGASRLVQPTAINDVWLKVASIYTQVVPNSRTEAASVDQYPSVRQTVTLASAPREVKVGITPHTQRIRIGEENVGVVYVALLKPLPAPGTVFIDFWVLGQRYTLTDDGNGKLVGQGSGSVNYLTGALNITLKKLPDVGSSITITHGEKSAYTNRSGQAGYRAPEFAWALPHQCVKPGSVVVTWMSGGVLKTATDNGSGAFTGHAAGEIDYASGKIYLRPTAMIDAGGEFQTAYEYASTRTENFNAPAVDAGGFGSLVLSEVPAAKSITVRWITERNVSSSSGTSEIVSSSGNATTAPPVTVSVQAPTNAGNSIGSSTTYIMPGNTVQFGATVASPQTPGTYTWEIYADTPDQTVILGGPTSGTFEIVAPPADTGLSSGGGGTMSNVPRPSGTGQFQLVVSAACPDVGFAVKLKNQALTVLATTGVITVDAMGSQPAPAWPTTPPPPVITTREPTTTGGTVTGPSQGLARMEHAGWAADTGARVFVKVERTALPAGSIYADPEGMGYDLPVVDSAGPSGTESVYWTPSDFAAGFKTIFSVAGVATVYHLWK